MAFQSKNLLVTAKEKQTEASERIASGQQENTLENYKVIKVEQIDNGYENDENGNFERHWIPLEDRKCNGKIRLRGLEITEISEKERLELKLEIETNERKSEEDIGSTGLNDTNCQDDDSENSAYLCALCKESVKGLEASRSHLAEHVCEKSFDCCDCNTLYTLDCLQNDHTLVFSELVGETLAGRLYRYFSTSQLLIKDNADGNCPQIENVFKTEHSSIDTLLSSSCISMNSDDCTDSQKRTSCSQASGQSSASLSCVSTIHFAAASLYLREETNNSRSVERPYVCMVCYKKFSASNTLIDHLILLHNQIQFDLCPNCNIPFANQKKLRIHLLQNEKTGCEIHVCTFCDKTFKKQELMRSHMYRHTGRGSFECQHCKKTWKNRSLLKRHLESHKTEKAYLCCVCSKRFSTANSLKVHMNIHTGERSYACTICTKVYSEQRFLRVHMCSHTGEGKYVCKICSKPFYSSSQLKLHMCKHTGERPHVCKICNEAFIVKNSLLRHMYRHNGLKPYTCITCGKNFVLKQDLSEHAKIHAVRSHTCSMCDRAFTTGAYLNRHMKTHKKKEQFECESCDLTFTEYQSLANHKAIH